MKGLLYKEYVSTHGKKLLLAFVAVLFCFLAVRIALPGGDSRNLEEAFEVQETLNTGEVYDTFLYSFVGMILLVGIMELAILVKILSSNDEGKMIRSYYQAMPMPKDALVRAKYLYYLLADVIVVGFFIVLALLYLIGAGHNQSTEAIKVGIRCAGVFAAVPLVIGAIDFYTFLGFGRKTGEVIRLLVLCPLGLAACAYLFFGDLNVISNFDIGTLTRWYRSHRMLFRVIAIGSPLLGIGIFRLSFLGVRKRLYKKGVETE